MLTILIQCELSERVTEVGDYDDAMGIITSIVRPFRGRLPIQLQTPDDDGHFQESCDRVIALPTTRRVIK